MKDLILKAAGYISSFCNIHWHIHKKDRCLYTLSLPSTILYSWNAKDMKLLLTFPKEFVNSEVTIPANLKPRPQVVLRKTNHMHLCPIYLSKTPTRVPFKICDHVEENQQQPNRMRRLYTSSLYSLIKVRLLMNINNKISKLREYWYETQLEYRIRELLHAYIRLHHAINLQSTTRVNKLKLYK